MFRPMTYAPRGRISQSAAVASASFARGSPICQRCSSMPPMPRPFSRLCSGPATKPSSEMDMWQVVSCIGVSSGSMTELLILHRHPALHGGSDQNRVVSQDDRPDDGDRDCEAEEKPVDPGE